jgi:hypothetical protein
MPELDADDPAPVQTPTRLADIEAIRQVKARYFRGIDTFDGALVRSVLAEDCVLDYTACFTDPATGVDFIPQMNAVIRGRSSWGDGSVVAAMGLVTVHQGYHHEIVVTAEDAAEARFAMTDRIFFPPGHAYRLVEGFGIYHDTYEKVGGSWRLKTARLQRLKVVGS